MSPKIFYEEGTRFCPACGADLVGNDPHAPDCAVPAVVELMTSDAAPVKGPCVHCGDAQAPGRRQVDGGAWVCATCARWVCDDDCHGRLDGRRYKVRCEVWGGATGYRSALAKRDGAILTFATYAEASAYARAADDRTRTDQAHYRYTVVPA